jgi:hypothetical protein
LECGDRQAGFFADAFDSLFHNADSYVERG